MALKVQPRWSDRWAGVQGERLEQRGEVGAMPDSDNGSRSDDRVLEGDTQQDSTGPKKSPGASGGVQGYGRGGRPGAKDD